MAPKIHFIGTGADAGVRGLLSEGGFVIETDTSLIAVDPGPGAAPGIAAKKIPQINEIVVTDPLRGHDADLLHITKKNQTTTIIKRPSGITFKLPDGIVTYVTAPITKGYSDYSCDALIVFARHAEKTIAKLKPKVAIITGYTKDLLEKNPVYLARELHAKTGVQTIAAQDGMTVDLLSYSAVSEQKGLSKFTPQE